MSTRIKNDSDLELIEVFTDDLEGGRVDRSELFLSCIDDRTVEGEVGVNVLLLRRLSLFPVFVLCPFPLDFLERFLPLSEIYYITSLFKYFCIFFGFC